MRSFYEAKALEQQQRHLRHQDTAYNLEPNVKESPGGLRDLQTILWIAPLPRVSDTPGAELAAHGLMTDRRSARTVARHETLIADLRTRLHYLADRREDRLVFDLQTQRWRSELGLSRHAESRRASEQLMQRYYRAAKSIRQINVILLQNLHARLFPAEVKAQPIDADFQAVDELLDMRDEELFAKRPSAILDSFLALQRHPRAQGHVGANAARAMARPQAGRRRVPPRSCQSRTLHRNPAPTARRHSTSCGG